jgi:hypothetical protein
MAATILHVRVTPRGRWAVQADEYAMAVSEHETAGEAERAAREFAVTQEQETYIVLHDRYMRTRASGPIKRRHAEPGVH